MISIICCIAKNLAIGKNNKLLYDIQDDMDHFRKITKGHMVVMGQKTFESIGRPLPNRTNVIITREEKYKANGCVILHSIDETIDFINTFKDEEIFIIGGGEIYRQFIHFADKLYLTIVDDEPADADTFFPDYSRFKNIESEENRESAGYKYKFVELTKK